MFGKSRYRTQFCIFERGVADELEINVESGYREKFPTLGGGIYAYGHEVELETLGLRFQSYVYFAEGYEIKRNLLGRQGWLQLVKLGLEDYKSEISCRLQICQHKIVAFRQKQTG